MTAKLIRPIPITESNFYSSNVPEDDYSEYSAGTTYAKDARVIVTSGGVHSVYQSLQNSNTGNSPTAANSTFWIRVSSTNKWRLHDNSVSLQTSHAESIANEYHISGTIDSLVLLNILGNTLNVTLTDVDEGVVYDKTINLIDSSGVNNWYSYFVEPIVRRRDVVITDIPPYGNPKLNFALSLPGENALIGECVIGQSRTIGSTQYGATVGIQSYSVKSKDSFGAYSIVPRGFSKRANFTIDIPSGLVDEVQRLLADFTDIPIVYIGSQAYSSAAIYGFWKDFNINIAMFSTSICTLEIEGLT
jgi:hypothetical protein